MRVTSNASANALIQQINRLALRQNRLQTQAATNQRIFSPEDDPGAVTRVLNMQSESRAVRQFQDNAERQQEIATATHGAIKSLKTISDRIGEIATLADGLSSPEELHGYATEVRQLLDQALAVANTRFNGEYLFAGTRTDQPPFAATRDPNGGVTAVTYSGNQSVPGVEVAVGITVSARVPGANQSGSGLRGLFANSSTGADFLGHIVSLAQHLDSGDASAIADTDRALLQKDEDNLLYHIAYNGSVQARLTAAKAQLADQSATLDGQISREVDADLAQTLIEFNSAQTAYQAALQTSAKLLDLGLINYLR